MSRGARCASPPASAPLVGGGLRARAPLPEAHARAAQQPRAERPQPVAGAAAAAAAGAGGAAGGCRQGGSQTASGGRRRRLVLRPGARFCPRGGGDADAQLGAPSSQPNGQVLHVLRAAAPSSHSPGERAHDARRPAGGSLKSHPVVGGIALTPRYSPRPRLDNIRPAAAPPEEPVEYEPPATDRAPAALAAALALPPSSRRPGLPPPAPTLAGPS